MAFAVFLIRKKKEIHTTEKIKGNIQQIQKHRRHAAKERKIQNEIQLGKHNTNNRLFIRPSSRVRPTAVVICPSIRPVVRSVVVVCPSSVRPVASRRRRRRPMPVRPSRCPSRRRRLASVRPSVRSFVRLRTHSFFLVAPVGNVGIEALSDTHRKTKLDRRSSVLFVR